MSVNTQIHSILKKVRDDTANAIFLELSTYQQHLVALSLSISSTLATLNKKHNNQLAHKQIQIAALNDQIIAMSRERQELQERYKKLEEECERAREQQEQQDLKMRELKREISDIRGYIEKRQENQDKNTQKEIVNFDDSYNADSKFNDLQTINEVTEYDMSVTASLASLPSCILQGQDRLPVTPNCSLSELNLQQKSNRGNIQQVGNYQDALEFLKKYNNQAESPTMYKKKKIMVMDPALAKQNIPLNQTGQLGKAKNGTIAKIKKMKHIDSLELQSAYVVKNAHLQPRSDKDSKNSSRSSLPSNLSSACSTRLRSQQIISLQLPLSRLVCVINGLRVSSPTHIDMLRPSICTISYKSELTYRGNCNHKHLPSGYGKLYFRDEVVYQGEWRQGKFHGWGKLIIMPFLTRQQKEVIEVDGNFRNGQLQGTCICVFTSGERFMGCIKAGAIEGEGTFVGQKGIMTGHWEDSCLILLI